MNKQKTGRKMGKNPPKKVFLSAPLTSWPSLASKVANFWGKSCQLLRQKLPSQLLRQKLPTFEDRPEMLHNISAKDCYVAQHIRQGEEELVKFTNHLNSFHRIIKFDVVKEESYNFDTRSINFLDLKIWIWICCSARKIRGLVPGWNQLTLACVGRESQAASHTDWVATWAQQHKTHKLIRWKPWVGTSDYLDMKPTGI